MTFIFTSPYTYSLGIWLLWMPGYHPQWPPPGPSQMLVNFFAKSKMISLTEWKIQFFPFVISVTTKWVLLITMAYDRYVTICKLLHYLVIITKRLSIQLLVLSFLGGLVHAILHNVFKFRLTFYNSIIIQDIYCDIVPLFKISCTDPSINFLIVFIFSESIQLCIILTVLVPYKVALFTILKKKSVQGIRKAFYTSGAHLLTISLYYDPLFSMYVLPGSAEADAQDTVDSLFWTVIIPLLNPVIYSLGNKKIIGSLAKMLKKMLRSHTNICSPFIKSHISVQIRHVLISVQSFCTYNCPRDFTT